MKIASYLQVLALGFCLLAALPADPAQAAQLQIPPPLRLDAPDQEGSLERTALPAPVQAAAPVLTPVQAEARPESAAAPALPPLSPQSATAQSATGQSAEGQPPAGKDGASVPLPDLNIAWGGYFQALGLLCLVLAALWALLWFFKRRGGLGGFMLAGGQVMRIESRLALGPKKWIIVIRYLDRRLVMGVTDQNISLLTEFRDDEVTGSPEKMSGADGGSGAEGKAGLPDLSFAELMIRDKKGPEADAG